MFGKALVPTDFSECEKKPFYISPGAELRARKVFLSGRLIPHTITFLYHVSMGMAACLKHFPDCNNMLSCQYCPALTAQAPKYSGTGSLFW